MIFNGKEITGLSPDKISKLGMGRSFQITSIFPDLTVEENVRIAFQSRTTMSYRFLKKLRPGDGLDEKSRRVLEQIRLGDKAGLPAKHLSHGEKRVLDIGIGIAADPRLLLLDEPASGLVGDEITRVTDLVREISSRVTVVLVEHNIDVVLSISDRITVLYYGEIIAEGSPGRDPVERPGAGGLPGGPVLTIENIHTYYGNSYILQGVSLTVKKGEVVTLLGRNGMGKSTTIKTVMGLVAPREGRVLLNGKDITGRKPYDIARAGVGFVPEDRRTFPSLSVLENLNLPIRRKSAEGWSLDKVFEFFPRLKQRSSHKGFGAIRGRAADARHRPHPADEERADPPRRADGGTCAASGQGHRRHHRANKARRHHDAPGGAERALRD